MAGEKAVGGVMSYRARREIRQTAHFCVPPSLVILEKVETVTDGDSGEMCPGRVDRKIERRTWNDESDCVSHWNEVRCV